MALSNSSISSRLKRWIFIFIKWSDFIPTNFHENKTRPVTVLTLYSSLSLRFISYTIRLVALYFRPRKQCMLPVNNVSWGCHLMELELQGRSWSQGVFDILLTILSSYPSACCFDEMRLPNGGLMADYISSICGAGCFAFLRLISLLYLEFKMLSFQY